MRKLIRKLDAALMRGYDFISNTHYYWRCCGCTFGQAVDLARKTL